jgi:hypothetical protein
VRFALTATVLVAVCVGLAPASARAATRVSVYLDAFNLPAGSTIGFADIGGSCDADKVYPSLVNPSVSGHGGTFHFALFTARNTGSCLTAGSNAQYLVTVRTPQTTVGTTKINVTQNRGAGTEYVIRCYDTRDMSCYGDTRGNVPTDGNVEIYMSLGPVTGPETAAPPGGYTYCATADVNQICAFGRTTQAKATVAYGTDGHYVYAEKSWVGGGVACSLAEFGSDPVPGKVKACFYKIIQQ